MKWTIPFVWDVLSSNSLAYFDMRSSPTEGRQSVAVSLDLGSSAFSVGTSSVHPTSNGVEPVFPLPSGADISSTLPDSHVNMSYGSGGIVAKMGFSLMTINDQEFNVTLGAMESYDPPFPMGGNMNDVGILGLSWAANLDPPPYCVNGALPVITPLGRSCDPSSDSRENLPLLDQLFDAHVVDKKTVEMLFEGSTQEMKRYGSLSYGGGPTYSGTAIELIPFCNQQGAYLSYYIIRIPEIHVGNFKLPYTERELQGNITYPIPGAGVEWFGGWIIDSGFTYSTYPYSVYMNITAQIWEEYTGNMPRSKWDQLVEIGKTSQTNCSVGPQFCAALDKIPCVSLLPEEIDGLPTVTMYIGGDSRITWNFSATNYMYPLYNESTGGTNCYQLALAAADLGRIGNLQMSGYQVFLDQDTKTAQIVEIPITTYPSPAPTFAYPSPAPTSALPTLTPTPRPSMATLAPSLRPTALPGTPTHLPTYGGMPTLYPTNGRFDDDAGLPTMAPTPRSSTGSNSTSSTPNGASSFGPTVIAVGILCWLLLGACLGGAWSWYQKRNKAAIDRAAAAAAAAAGGDVTGLAPASPPPGKAVPVAARLSQSRGRAVTTDEIPGEMVTNPIYRGSTSASTSSPSTYSASRISVKNKASVSGASIEEGAAHVTSNL